MFKIEQASVFYPPSQKTTALAVDECEEKSRGATADFEALKFWRITRRSQTQKQFGEDGYNQSTTGLPVGIYKYEG